jgi:hypothetical protein
MAADPGAGSGDGLGLGDGRGLGLGRDEPAIDGAAGDGTGVIVDPQPASTKAMTTTTARRATLTPRSSFRTSRPETSSQAPAVMRGA